MVRYLSHCGSVANTRALPFVACQNEAYSNPDDSTALLHKPSRINRRTRCVRASRKIKSWLGLFEQPVWLRLSRFLPWLCCNRGWLQRSEVGLIRRLLQGQAECRGVSRGGVAS